jgi:hypothetical protein
MSQTVSLQLSTKNNILVILRSMGNDAVHMFWLTLFLNMLCLESTDLRSIHDAVAAHSVPQGVGPCLMRYMCDAVHPFRMIIIKIVL